MNAKDFMLHHHHGRVKPDCSADIALDTTLKDLLSVVDGSRSLQIFGFTSDLSITDGFYEHIIKLPRSNISLRLLVLPEYAHKDWRCQTESFFGLHVRVRRGGGTQETSTSYRGAQAERERPITKGDGHERKYLDVYCHQGCDLGTIEAALRRPENNVDEANIYGPSSNRLQAAVEEWQAMCERMGLKIENLKELGLYECMLGPISPLANLKLSANLGAISIVNSVSDWDIPDTVDRNLLAEMGEFSTEELLRRLASVHANNTTAGMYRFVYRQNIRNGTSDNPNDPISNEALKSFIEQFPEWRILCIQHNTPYDGSLVDFARPTLEYASFRFADQQFSERDIKYFADRSPNLKWLGINVHEFTRCLEEGKLTVDINKNMKILVVRLPPPSP